MGRKKQQPVGRDGKGLLIFPSHVNKLLSTSLPTPSPSLTADKDIAIIEKAAEPLTVRRAKPHHQLLSAPNSPPESRDFQLPLVTAKDEKAKDCQSEVPNKTRGHAKNKDRRRATKLPTSNLAQAGAKDDRLRRDPSAKDVAGLSAHGDVADLKKKTMALIEKTSGSQHDSIYQAPIVFAGHLSDSIPLWGQLTCKQSCMFPNHLKVPEIRRFLEPGWTADRIMNHIPDDCRHHVAQSGWNEYRDALQLRLDHCRDVMLQQSRPVAPIHKRDPQFWLTFQGIDEDIWVGSNINSISDGPGRGLSQIQNSEAHVSHNSLQRPPVYNVSVGSGTVHGPGMLMNPATRPAYSSAFPLKPQFAQNRSHQVAPAGHLYLVSKSQFTKAIKRARQATIGKQQQHTRGAKRLKTTIPAESEIINLASDDEEDVDAGDLGGPRTAAVKNIQRTKAPKQPEREVINLVSDDDDDDDDDDDAPDLDGPRGTAAKQVVGARPQEKSNPPVRPTIGDLRPASEDWERVHWQKRADYGE